MALEQSCARHPGVFVASDQVCPRCAPTVRRALRVVPRMTAREEMLRAALRRADGYLATLGVTCDVDVTAFRRDLETALAE